MLEEIIPLTPVHFFAFGANLYEAKENKLKNRHLLADLSPFHGDFSFAEVYLGWNDKGIVAEITAPLPFDKSDFPDFQQGDSIELFFDTRDVKTTAYVTKFCHHFYFLPEPIEMNGENTQDTVQAGEVTRFRGEDKHELCDASKLQVISLKERRRKVIKIFIPRECLYGYDPTQFDRLGFTYRINRYEEASQYFSANDREFAIEQTPSLWASFKLVKE